MDSQLMDAFTLLLAIAALLVAVVAAVRSGRNLDDAMAERLAKMSDPDQMERMERMYQTASEPVKQLIDTVSSLVAIVAPLTPTIKADDSAAKLLKDIQTPGKPNDATPAAAG